MARLVSSDAASGQVFFRMGCGSYVSSLWSERPEEYTGCPLHPQTLCFCYRCSRKVRQAGELFFRKPSTGSKQARLLTGEIHDG